MLSGKNVAQRLVVGLLTLACLTAFTQAQGAEWYVTPGGSAGGAGTMVSPWSLQAAFTGPATVHGGDTIWVRAGNYAPPNGEYFTLTMRAAGADANNPVKIRAYPGERATITNWLRAANDTNNLAPAAGYVWLMDMEIAGSTMAGMDLDNGDSLKFINCVLHNNQNGAVGDWSYLAGTRYGSRNSEIYGCVIYDNGYYDPATRWHGHAIYSQNGTGLGYKTISNNILHTLGQDDQFTVHLYGQGAETKNYLVTQNIAYQAFGWIMGSGLPSDNLQMISNYLWNITHVYFGSPWSPDRSGTNGLLRDNLVVNPQYGLQILHWQTYTEANDLVVQPAGSSTTDAQFASFAIIPAAGSATYLPQMTRPHGTTVVLLPNKYDVNRANLAIFNWDHASTVTVSLSPVVSAGQPYQLYAPTGLYSAPAQSGTYDGTPITVNMSGSEFATFVLRYQGQASNQAPAVNAGTDATIHQPITSVSLTGTVTDDGLPQGAFVTSTWSMTSGPGTVTFGSVNSPATTATFSALGTYVLRLTASDTALSAYDEVQIISAPPVPNQAPVVNAGIDKVIQQPVNSVALAGTVSDDGLPAGQSVTVTWSKTSGPGTVTFANANALSTTATFSTLGTYVLRLTAGDTALSAFDECTVTVQAAGTLTMILHLPFDESSGTTAADTSGNGRNAALSGGTTFVAGHSGNAAHFDEISGKAVVPTFPLTNEFTLSFWFKPDDNIGSSLQYLFSWGPTPGSPAPADSVVVWISEASYAPANVFYSNIQDHNDNYGADPLLFTDLNVFNGQWHLYTMTVSAATGATVYLDGQFRTNVATLGGGPIAPNTDVFIGGRSDNNANRFFGGCIDDLRIYNSALTAADVQTLFNPVVNAAPTANAGVDHKVMMPYGTALTGSMSDDGLPSPPAACTAAWSKVSGPGTVTFGNPAAAATTATFSTAGTYVLRLTAGDSALSGTDDVTIIVLKAGDFTGDGKIDGLDFLNWQAHYPNFIGGATCDGGDATNDGLVDGRDFLVWQANYRP